MSFTDHRTKQLIDNLDRIATALERVSDHLDGITEELSVMNSGNGLGVRNQ